MEITVPYTKRKDKEDNEGGKLMKFQFIGLGAAGNKAMVDIVNAGVAKPEDVILINSTTKDFVDCDGVDNKVVLNPQNTGCGKERRIAREYAEKALKLHSIKINENTTNVLLVTSVEGGTGSGATPVIAEAIRKKGVNIHICAFIGFEDDVRGLQNTVEFFKEISSLEADIMTIRNASFNEEAKYNKFKAEELANQELVKRAAILTGQNLIVSGQNIDDTDIFKVVSTSGYKTIEEIKFSENLMDQEQFNKLCKEMIYRSHSLVSENPGQVRLGVILNIKPESEDAIDYTFKAFKDAYGMPYEMFFHKQYDGKEQYIQFISSGMKLPLEEVKAVYTRYKDQTKKVDKSNDAFNEMVNSFEFDEVDSMFDMVRSSKTVINTNKED